ncbi:MAG: glycogen/starch synthase, partial [Candidatus Glassbacteria bacterium]|nr:glycogen/starch synthase [Candidatus Glassbacteria bacterium]
VFTIHNLGYQGLFPESRMQLTGLGRSYYTPEGLEYYGQMSLLKGGIVFADSVTTVSEGYAAEIQTEEYGCGLHSLLHSYRDKLTGILNGADYRAWDPAADSLLPCNYSPADLSGKARCKDALQQEAGLPRRPGTPLIGMVTRLAEQKGFDLLAGAVEELMRLDLQVVVLGRGDTRYEDLVQEFSRRFPERFACRIAFDKRLSHLVQAGSDFFLMPSRYEPCGLSQIYSLRYGTVPLVRATGGLEDTVVDVRSDPRHGTGFKFREYSAGALVETVAGALDYFRNRPEQWRRMMDNAFAADFSWVHSARRYRQLYRETYRKKFGSYPPPARSSGTG